MEKQAAEELHTLTSTEAARQFRELHDCRTQFANELAKTERARANGGYPAPVPLTEPERKKLDYAKSRLNGHATSLLRLPPSGDHESELKIKIGGLDLALEALAKSATALRAAEALQRAQDNAHVWQRIAHDYIIALARVEALEERAYEFLRDVAEGYPQLPLAEYVGCLIRIEFQNGYRVEHAIRDALRERIVKKSEIEEAQHVK